MINEQTPGPLEVVGSEIISRQEVRYVAEVSGPNRADLVPVKRANARLLAAGYNAFDKAARELGVDAVELAEKLDLAEVIRLAIACDTNPASKAYTVKILDQYHGVTKHKQP